MSHAPHLRNPLLTAGFRLLLVVSLWQGPVAWIHMHAPDAEGLADHLARFHADDPDPFCLGWHWHLSSPVTGEPTSDHEKPANPHPAVLGSQVTVCCSSISVDAPAELSVLSRLHTLSSDHGTARATVAFLGTFCPAHTAQQVLCRINC